MDAFIGLVIGYLIGAVYTAFLFAKRQPKPVPPIVERPQVYHDAQARRLLAECDNLSL